MKGYLFKQNWYGMAEPKLGMESVQCRRCRNVWKEEMVIPLAVAGYARYYDYCDKCITPAERTEPAEDKP